MNMLETEWWTMAIPPEWWADSEEDSIVVAIFLDFAKLA